MESLPTALVAGIALGILEQVVRWNSTTSPSIVSVVFLVVIVGALLLQRSAFSRSGEGARINVVGHRRAPPDTRRRCNDCPRCASRVGALIAAVGLALVLVPQLWSPSTQLLAAFALIWGMIAVSLVVLTGWGGNISLGQFGVAGAGAMVAGNLIARNNLDLIFVLLLAGAAGAAIALVIGLPGASHQGLVPRRHDRSRSRSRSTATSSTSTTSPSLIPSSVPRPLLFGRFNLEDQYTMYVFCLSILLAAGSLIASGHAEVAHRAHAHRHA